MPVVNTIIKAGPNFLRELLNSAASEGLLPVDICVGSDSLVPSSEHMSNNAPTFRFEKMDPGALLADVDLSCPFIDKEEEFCAVFLSCGNKDP